LQDAHHPEISVFLKFGLATCHKFDEYFLYGVGLNLFFDPSRTDSTYTLNRVMMAVAATDGTFVPEMNDESWIGKDRSAHPYTEEEQQMLIKGFEAAGAEYKDLNKGDFKSQEIPGVNITSPVTAFKGYPR
jgi:hypothetical protein